MELNHRSYVQNGKLRQCSKDSPRNLETGSQSKVMRENTPFESHNDSTEYKIMEHVSSLPTVFEGKTTMKLGKLSNREQLSNIVYLRKSRSSHDVTGEDPRPLSPFPFARYSSQESLDDNVMIRSTGLRMPHRKISSPLPAGMTTSPLCVRRRTLSDSPAEALISPVIPRRCGSPLQLKKGVPRVMSCPIITSDSNEHVSQLTPSPPVSPRYNFDGGPHKLTSSINACPALKSAEQEKLPRIHQTRSPMLVRADKTPTESARELFNVSPVMGQPADLIKRLDNNNECDAIDKVQYFLHTLTAEEDLVDQ